MKRPKLVHFFAITNDEYISIRASVTMHENPNRNIDLKKINPPRFPIQGIRLMNAHVFFVKIVGLDSDQNEVYHKTYQSDSFGNFHFKIPLTQETSKINILQIYDVRTNPGLELHLGTYIPIKISRPIKVIISDLDRTLVETPSTSLKEVYNSLTRPLKDFPIINESIEIMKQYVDKGFHPFILSASPHFYEDAIRDWLYAKKIYTAGIFLKDYRQVFSVIEGHLYPKDLMVHGLYKLNQLLNILLMTSIPDELILMGDNYETDPLIYLTLATILEDNLDPWVIWDKVKTHKSFRLTSKQNSQILNKIHQLSNMLSVKRQNAGSDKLVNLKIYIRKKVETENDSINISLDLLEKKMHLIERYDAFPKKQS